MKVLLTAFDAFGEDSINPTQLILEQIEVNDKNIELVRVLLPTSFKRAKTLVEKAILEHKPDVVICLGQAGGRKKITVERVAINIMDARIKDNDGYQPVDIPIKEDGKTAYFSTLNIKEIVRAINEKNIPAEVSNTAGTFVCNSVLYSVLSLIEVNNLNTKACFIHVPYLKEQDINNLGHLELKQMIDAVKVAILSSELVH